MEQKFLDAQRQQWQDSFLEMPEMFSSEAGHSAHKAAAFFTKEDKINILELGCGQGRDTIFLARKGFNVYALDYSNGRLEAIDKKAQELKLPDRLRSKHLTKEIRSRNSTPSHCERSAKIKEDFF
jgi:cyclopropane fatty-acyl-phospholipid synthase-like methyltransferase